VEINFFHGAVRRGLVITYVLDEEARCYRRSARAMVMNFRKAAGGYREDGEMERESQAIGPLETAAATNAGGADFYAALTLERSVDLSREDYLERVVATADTTDFDVASREDGYVFTTYPEGLFLCAPDSVSVEEGRAGFELQFGCDFRRDGGPVKLLRVKFGEKKQLVGWGLHELV
jgi:hypothetical protein